MNRIEFLNELEKELQDISVEERESALEYYSEYFDDAGKENEEAVLKELHSPQSVAAQIRANATMKRLESTPSSAKHGWKAAWVTVGMIFAAPIALPLAIAAAAVVVALLISLAAVLFAFMASSAAIALSGIVMFFGSFFMLSSGLANFLLSFGYSCICLAISVLIFVPTLQLSRICFKKIALFINRKISERRNKSEK